MFSAKGSYTSYMAQHGFDSLLPYSVTYLVAESNEKRKASLTAPAQEPLVVRQWPQERAREMSSKLCRKVAGASLGTDQMARTAEGSRSRGHWTWQMTGWQKTASTEWAGR